MSKHHKYRAWDDTLLRYHEPKTIAEILAMDSSGINIYQLHFEQFTGVIDRHGNEIYEGDIVTQESCDGDSYTDQVEMHYSGTWSNDGGNQLNANYVTSLEIIGNIHQNPELLE